MAKGYNSTEYMYSSARLRSKEVAIASREQLLRLADADGTASIAAALTEFGFDVKYNSRGELLREETLASVLYEGFDTVFEMECAPAVEFLRYRYDCNNIKAVIKCHARGISADSMLLPLGTVSIEAAKSAFFEGDYAAYPEHLAAAIPEAREAFANTGDPQKIDFIIDCACYADMLAAAERSGVALAVELVREEIDLLNIKMAVRLIRMGLGARTAGLFGDVYLQGGALSREFFAESLEGGESVLSDALRYGRYGVLSDMLSDGADLSAIDKKTEDMIMTTAKGAKFVPFGAEVAIGYIMALEYEVKNIRIILAGKSAGLAPETIKERLRENYV